MTVLWHPDCLRHDPGPGHPESPDRLRVLAARLDAVGREMLVAEPASVEQLQRVHPRVYLDRLHAIAEAGGGMLDSETVMNAASWEAALGAAGAAVGAVRRSRQTGWAFAATRPPGHHALADRAMGFCFLANVVIAAREAQASGSRAVLIVDWDVHHGNGTQALVAADPTVRFVSLHEWPSYPGTGSERETGCGNVFNVPRPAGLPPTVYVESLWEAIERACAGWTPSTVLVSAGFDSLAGDPLGGFTLEPDDLAEIARRLRGRCPDAPIVAVLEGGYVPSRLADGVLAVLDALTS